MCEADRRDLQLFQTICDDAVAQCGPDMSVIELHVEGAIDRLPAAKQLALRQTLDRMLKAQIRMDELAKPSRLS